jgi:DNA-directed RNA polymerase specialized sigma24 family protein
MRLCLAEEALTVCKKQKSRHKRKVGRKKQRRYRRFWRQVIAERYENILGFARRLTKDISDAHDLAQTVVWRLLKYCPNPVRVCNLDAYIWASTKHVASDLRHAQKEITFSDLRKADSPQVAVLDANIETFLAECDTEALTPKTRVANTKAAEKKSLVLQIKILVGEGYNLPAIAKHLNQPIRRVRQYWYEHRQAQQKVLRRSASGVAKVTGGEVRQPARVRRVPAGAPIPIVR